MASVAETLDQCFSAQLYPALFSPGKLFSSFWNKAHLAHFCRHNNSLCCAFQSAYHRTRNPFTDCRIRDAPPPTLPPSTPPLTLYSPAPSPLTTSIQHLPIDIALLTRLVNIKHRSKQIQPPIMSLTHILRYQSSIGLTALNIATAEKVGKLRPLANQWVLREQAYTGGSRGWARDEEDGRAEGGREGYEGAE